MVRGEWPGATAGDVDNNIVQAIEPEVRFINGVKRVRSSAFEGQASVSIEFEAGSDMQSGLSDVESAISRIRTLPEDSKTPEISRIVRHETIMRVVLSGPYPEASLKAQTGEDFRIEAFRKAAGILHAAEPDRARRVLELFSDPTPEPIPSAAGMKGADGAYGGASGGGGA